MLCYTQKWIIHWYFKFWVYIYRNLSPEIKCGVALTKVFLSQIFLHFGQFYFYSRQVCNKRLANWTAITDTLTSNGFTRNAKHGLNSWKWSNLAWNFSSTLTVYFSILPLCGLQLPLHEKHSFSFWHWENERTLSTICVFKKFSFSSGNLSGLTCDLGSQSLSSNRADSLVTRVPSKMRNCTNPQNHQSIWAGLSLILAHLQHSKFDIAYTSHCPFEMFHWLCVDMVVKMHAHQSKHLQNVKFSYRDTASD